VRKDEKNLEEELKEPGNFKKDKQLYIPMYLLHNGSTT